MYEKWMWINVRGKITCGSVFLYPILGLCFVSCEFAVANFRLNVEASYLRACIFYIVCWIPNVEGRFKAYAMCAHRKFCFIFIDSETHLIARFDDSLLHWVTGPSLGNCAPRSVMLKKRVRFDIEKYSNKFYRRQSHWLQITKYTRKKWKPLDYLYLKKRSLASCSRYKRIHKKRLYANYGAGPFTMVLKRDNTKSVSPIILKRNRISQSTHKNHIYVTH